MNWDDLKYFLAVCRMGSIRAAAAELNVNHATVSRRINNFEASLGQRLFERSAKGYTRTKIADEIYQESSHLEERLSTVARQIAGKDNSLSGDIRITLPDLFARGLLMPAIAEFCKQYPLIHIEIIDSARLFNLANREADVAFRVCEQPPEYLIAKQLAVMHRSCYMARKLLPELEQESWLEQQNWIGWNDKMRRPVGKIAREYPRFDSKHKITSAVLQAEACKNGMGIAVLPCFYGDLEPELVRVPPYSSEAKYNFWLVYHPDLRKNAKIQTFVSFMIEQMQVQKPLIEGEKPMPVNLPLL
ncbi:LysR family transcriptional regulator [Thalassomonas actiniarum]|uniref:LysR family transcriptional regulator n=1 Tax=Thalassomonas actiniarum TaxID=485447 RepID=A0AAE9YT69_9GAMM|nr:LysR family transcriptional regulator [Thalassomonas actiniarum]WDD99146.1 LysR family transcriptional regulator [Thalassomonas actiniarum]